MSLTRLCGFHDIPEGEARGFLYLEGHPQIFVVRRENQLYGYLNQCPHNLIPMEFKKDHFLNADKSKIICFAHGAHFEIQTGYCDKGICQGDYLTAIELTIEDGQVFWRQGLRESKSMI
ncbi:Rieske 2Fe-2S domain-containing protein [Alteromonas sp. NFXS44]|uniref:Rieske (2Fe-2S) protein n=1 Tax=Alteromonas sp. NFXS44 TaxID=2818435 RepID=UPI0032DF3CA3